MKRYILICFLLCLLSACGYAQSIQYGYFRKVSANDAGSIHVGIVNKQEWSIVLKTLYVNGHKISLAIDPGQKDEWNYFPPGVKEGDILWYYFTEPILGPSRATELIIKFAKSPIKSVDVKIETDEGQILTTVIDPKPTPLSVSFIGFSDDFSKAYIYIRNKGDTDFSINTLRLNSEENLLSDNYNYRSTTIRITD